MYKHDLAVSRIFTTAFNSICASLILAPLYTISASMQLSVMPHLHAYGAPDLAGMQKSIVQYGEEKKQLEGKTTDAVIKAESEIKIYKPERYEKLIEKSGQVGDNRPYRAPVYKSYTECVRGLY